jgi:small subunit ribosomal protein S1
MTELKQSTQDNGSEEMSFAELFEMEENNKVVAVGDVAMGTIIGSVDGYLLVDVGDKAESYISKSEFRLDGDAEIKIGDTFEVFVERRKEEGGLLLSREKAIAIKVWEQISPRSRKRTGPLRARLRAG